MHKTIRLFKWLHFRLKHQEIPYSRQQKLMDNLYFSKNKPTQPRTPTNTLFQNDSGTVGSSFDERIDLLEEQLNQLALNHNHSVIQINQIIDEVDEVWLEGKCKNDRTFERSIRSIEQKFINTLEADKEEILEMRSGLRKFVEQNGVVLSQAIRVEVQSEKSMQKDLENIIHKKMKDVRKDIQRIDSKSAKKEEGTGMKGQGGSLLKEKLKKGIEGLEVLLAQHKDRKNQMKRQGAKLLKEYLKILGDIEQGRADREAKEEQLLVKIEELSVGDVTKQNTISRIQ